MHPQHISILDFSYALPEDKIAWRPPARRDASKLLIYKNGEIKETHFNAIVDALPANTLMIFNNTKVINARILFKKETGASIEIFCLEPSGQITGYTSAMAKQQHTEWKCFIGGVAKWKNEILQKEIEIAGQTVLLKAELKQKEADAYIVRFSWEPDHLDFAHIIEAAGKVPLPPYIKRETEGEDSSRYQTIFAMQQGSVAAPTASLHFTPEIVARFPQKNIHSSFVTLHVGAGTFKPVKSATMQDHDMHAAYIEASRQSIEHLLLAQGPIAVAGTTSLRTVETIYWLGVKAFDTPTAEQLSLGQWDVYDAALAAKDFTAKQALQSLLQWMIANQTDKIFTQTQLLIAPGYRFRIANILVINFHQPQSTLLLLVAAAVGPSWRSLYEYALNHDFRFLSYGDANLIFINENSKA